MTKTLTEQWREGKLQFSRYYAKFADGSIDNITLSSSISLYESEHIKEVLAPVPSYDKFVQQRDFVKDHQKVLIENMNLKRKLEIATKAFKDIKEHTKELSLPSYTGMRCDKALKEIEEVK